ncbi:MAG TPA: thioredoxin domain-containing protein [Solirubrobacteraceae bacterium]|nr:thioredoxin domain-containing protein [Solirubrobacteraceae bacterium]
MANALAHESSPYLRQHAENPVDWLPWGPEALGRARQLDRPLLVSIGYSACHWCHVMERESFEDAAVAHVMNERFVCVKVDREERPDVDAIYMEAVQAMTGGGGWPLNVFLTPEQVPFYGGTYFPPEPRHGMPAWTQVLAAIAEAWEQDREEIRAGGERMRERLAGGARLIPSSQAPREDVLIGAVETLGASFDPRHGGFGRAPKFPQAPVLEFLLARAAHGGADAAGARAIALHTLHAMADGGIRDQLGGGFARYSVDAAWTVPHFEKMLYDNAQLARAYLHGWQLSGEQRLLAVCTSTLDWALREMRGVEGGFYSALDADSEGVEGRYYVWSVAELREVLGEDADAAIAWLGATEQGNFQDPHDPGTQREAARPGLNVLQGRGPEPDPPVRERIREQLLTRREQRTRPGLDDKRLTSWNALMIAALAEAGAALGHDGGTGGSRYLEAAVAGAEFVERQLRDPRGRLLRTYSAGAAKLDAYLEDHALLLQALIALFEATCEERWLQQAAALAGEMIARFADEQHGGFFSTAADAETLIVRRKDLEDSPLPSGSSAAAGGLLRLAQITGEAEYERRAAGAIALVAEIAPRHPSAFGHMLQAMHWQLAPARPLACPVPAAATAVYAGRSVSGGS